MDFPRGTFLRSFERSLCSFFGFLETHSKVEEAVKEIEANSKEERFTMRYPSDSASSEAASDLSSWVAYKNRGKACYERGDYEAALDDYKSALSPDWNASRQERQIILSNMVACRLKIGGSAQAAAAVANAKQCVALNPSWSKGHVRLASAYIALGEHSNDACNELQTALRLDPGNSIARQMLVRELRRDHAGAAASSEGVDDSDENRRDPPQNPDYMAPDHHNDINDDDPFTNVRIDDSPSVMERVQFFLARLSSWYSNLSSDVRMLIHIFVVILLLYIGFGGRFGLDQLFASDHVQRGNYGAGNAYDQYRRRHSGDAYHRDSYYSSTSDYHSRDTGYSQGGGYDDYTSSYGSPRRRNYGGSFSVGFSDGTLPSLLIMLGLGYICHRNGINPLHAMWMMNVMGGRRRRVFRPRGMAWGFGGGMPYGRRRARW